MTSPTDYFRTRMKFFYAALFVVIGTYLPFMPAWLGDKGLGAEQIGFVLMIPMLIRAFITPWIAYGIDRHGNRSLAAAVLALGAAGATLALFAVEGFAAVLVVFALVSLLWSPLNPVADAAAIAGVRAAGLDYGRMRLWGSASFIAANLGAGWLIDRYSPDAALAVMAVALAATGLIAATLPRLETQSAGAQPFTAASLKLLARGAFIAILLIAALLNASHAVIYAFGTLHWQSLGYSNTTIGVLWAVGVLAEIVLFAFSGAAIRRFGSYGLLALGAAAACVRWTAMAYDPPMAFLFVLQMLHAFTFGATYLGMVNLAADAVPERLGGTAQSMLHAAISVMLAGATLAAGRLYGSYGAEAFLAMASMGAAVLILLGGRYLYSLRR